MFRPRRLACSFCGRREADVAKLVAGPKVFICDRCVAVAASLMEEPPADQPRPRERQPGLLRSMWNRLRAPVQQPDDRRSECRAAAL